ncbi:GGDEF domain-containing protein [Deinococcus aquatilis]|uniref:GGDEF domain-containing protein n=1 Tax=Deinococcus aquatilis TaxID=519440 RepID=UPI0012FA2CCF|nr:GGDEF domain-containing protein [Deinococcus aquatilis]
MTQTPPPSMAALRDELRGFHEQIQASQDAADQALLHREAAYLALNIGETAVALTHALACLDLARACQDLNLQTKAHVAVAIVQAEGYDDLGAAEHFRHAEDLARAAGDHRGVALVAVNVSHYQMQRGEYLAAATQLGALSHPPYLGVLKQPDSAELRQVFHINYVVSAAEALMAHETQIADLESWRMRLRASAHELQLLHANQTGLTNALHLLDVLDALMRYALWQDDLPAAQQFADEFVQVSRRLGSTVMYGRALLNRSRVRARMQQWEGSIQDAEAAIAQFETGQHDLWAVRGRTALAEAYAQTQQFREAFETQREVTQQVESLYRQYHQQRALLGQITQQAREAEVRATAFAEAALQDSLTGIPNRAYAMQLLAQLHGRAQQGESSAIALVDLDHFKQVNDTSGHAAGDLVLTRVAQTLNAGVRAVDSVARFGGEEFVVILRGVTLADAQDSCERLRRVLNDLNWDDVVPGLRTSASFGLAMLDGQRDLKATLHAADKALYRAKASGRNVVRTEHHSTDRIIDLS